MIGFGVCEVVWWVIETIDWGIESGGDDMTNIGESGEVSSFLDDNAFRLANGVVGDPVFLSRLLWRLFFGFRVGEKIIEVFVRVGNGAEMDFLASSSNGGRRVVEVPEGSNVGIELIEWASSAEMSTDDL